MKSKNLMFKSPPAGRYIHNVRKRGKALLGALIELLVT
jgi:hypothetical protein